MNSKYENVLESLEDSLFPLIIFLGFSAIIIQFCDSSFAKFLYLDAS